MADIRVPEEGDRQRIVDLMRISFNAPTVWTKLLAPALRMERFLCAYEGERILAMAQAYDLQQWFGGCALPMAGIAAVAALPERRDAGLAPSVMKALLRRSREKGALLSTLYPSRGSVYRRLGYEYSGVLTQYRVNFADLPSARAAAAAAVEELDERELEAVQACYRDVAKRHNGLVDSGEEDWWRLRILRKWNPEVNSRCVVLRGPLGIEGYATFQLDPVPDSWGHRLTCTHLVARSAQALTGLLAYFRSFRGLGQALVFYGPANDPIGLLTGGGADALHPLRALRFMTRLLDVPGALRARGYPPVSGRAILEVEDDLFADNRGPFVLEAHEGRVRVEPLGQDRQEAAGQAERANGGSQDAGSAAAPFSAVGPAGSAGRPIPIGALSALFTGYLSPWELVRAGLIEAGHPALPFLSSLFAGSAPWMTDFF